MFREKALSGSVNVGAVSKPMADFPRSGQLLGGDAGEVGPPKISESDERAKRIKKETEIELGAG